MELKQTEVKKKIIYQNKREASEAAKRINKQIKIGDKNINLNFLRFLDVLRIKMTYYGLKHKRPSSH